MSSTDIHRGNHAILHQWFATIATTLGIFLLGAALGFTSPALPSMVKEPNGLFGNITENQKSWIGSMATLGALCGSPIAGFSVEKFGRKISMVVISFPFLLSWILIAFSKHLPLLLVARFISGLCGGVFSLIVPLYISEIAEDHIRGTLASIFQLMLVSGILFTYTVGTFVTWKTLAIICSAVAVPLCILTFFVPESPRYLLKKGRQQDAEKSLQWFRNSNSDEELENMRVSVEESSAHASISCRDFVQPSIYKPLFVSLCLMVFEQFSGFNAVIFYTNDIFKASGTNIDSNLSTIIVGVIQVLATVVSSVLVDRAGRRPLLLFGQVVMAVALFAFGTFFYIHKTLDQGHMKLISWIPITSLCVFVIAFAIGIGPLSWTIMGEIVPPHAKGLCSGIAVSVVWFSAFVVTKLYANLLEIIGIENTFMIYGATCVLGFFVVHFFVPETKGKSLDEIQRYFA